MESIIWVHGLAEPLETVSVCYLAWGDERVFEPQEALPDPARVVRSLVDTRPSRPIGRWVLRDPVADVSGPFLALWRKRAVETLLAALAQEIELDRRLMFRGPPTARFRPDGAENVDMGSLSAIQRAVGWVYENPRELENRHGLMAAEVSRTSLRDGGLADLASVMRAALEGAKIAYGFGVSQQSRDALKTLSDLRKAVSEETGKLADATRSVAAAVTTAAIGNVGLVIARVTLAKDVSFIASAAVFIGVALAVYVAVVIASGWHFLAIQRDLRSDWRERLYRFLPDDEYDRMVTVPVGRAERGFVNAAVGSGVVAGLLLIAAAVIAASA